MTQHLNFINKRRRRRHTSIRNRVDWDVSGRQGEGGSKSKRNGVVAGVGGFISIHREREWKDRDARKSFNMEQTRREENRCQPNDSLSQSEKKRKEILTEICPDDSHFISSVGPRKKKVIIIFESIQSFSSQFSNHRRNNNKKKKHPSKWLRDLKSLTPQLK